ncbi:threonine synthase [Tepidibacter hydrothermalis]|uniref:Threonine synthase n=1 Tax=Tepidibacter hydrothermalis TaxID=3036126 RepID=A0ABY8EHF8_9FIRM|nr:threonine synthase [Tepidibacter hydrothermalis]WFD12381.1 threonine synthase [Tepidibacter hydrothermalis]
MLYKSTRGDSSRVTSSNAILKGLAKDGGLYVPTQFPYIDIPFKDMIPMDYKEIAFYIINKFFTDFDDSTLKNCIDNAYDDKFSSNLIAPLKNIDDNYFLELYHGPTLAFKDMALSILPHLLKASCKNLNIQKEVVILTATSGDTGKAALEGFNNVDKTKIIVFYPKKGVSTIQEKQMITQDGKNTHVIGIDGNFDDAQRGVKEIFSDKEFNNILSKQNYMLSSANSINIGRLVPQIVYYVNSYIQLLKNEDIKENEKINIVVPTGNFGNILAAFYAKKMGLPINKLICASNHNNVLCDFINTGIYDVRREFKLTSSPSMDILVSSNLERLLYEISNSNPCLVKNLMEDLKVNGIYEINEDMKNKLDDFYADFATEEETLSTIKKVYNDFNYVIDTHTSVAYCVYQKYRQKTNDSTKTIIASTASPFKFPESVIESIDNNYDVLSDFQLIDKLSNISNIEIPKPIKELESKRIIHCSICKKDKMKSMITNILNV